jgi:hypothetical protein
VARVRSIAIAALAATALISAPSAAYAHTGAHDQSVIAHSSDAFTMTWAHYRGELLDLRPTTTEALDGATASAVMVGLGSSHFTLKVKGIDQDAAGKTFGAHLHLGPCLAGDWAGATGLGHYNTDILGSAIPPVISRLTEVWLDFEVTPQGDAKTEVTVPFVPQPGERSIVIHALPTAPDGTAGDRLACLPLVINQLIDVGS